MAKNKFSETSHEWILRKQNQLREGGLLDDDLPPNPIFEKKPDLTKKCRQNKIPAMHKQPIAIRIKNISLAEWGIIWTIIAGVIALWIYVVQPLMSKWLF